MLRVKLYKLNDVGTWDDHGTGHVNVEYYEVRTPLQCIHNLTPAPHPSPPPSRPPRPPLTPRPAPPFTSAAGRGSRSDQ
jgi:hypothetical protein